jgi:hypothetical protein
MRPKIHAVAAPACIALSARQLPFPAIYCCALPAMALSLRRGGRGTGAAGAAGVQGEGTSISLPAQSSLHAMR